MDITSEYSNIYTSTRNCAIYIFIIRLRTAAELLKKGARTGIKDDDGKTPLHCATSNGHFETVKLLINNQADIDSAYVKSCVLTNLHMYVCNHTLFKYSGPHLTIRREMVFKCKTLIKCINLVL